MKLEHKIIREMLTKMPKPAAEQILKTNLPLREFQAIYHRDIEQKDLISIGEEILNCSESNVKKIRKSGYEKLAAFYFSHKKDNMDIL